ncbi:MAG: ABC transporter ATP-binding protein [Candidatus Thorarchaeota archaeon]|nr:MAG: ABC transporter ATP-binding protein [Candidatus Thorarchaeota archaeon]
MDILKINNLTVEYYTRRGTARAVDRVFLNLEENKTLGLAGESGCGKSTLGRSIMRIVQYPGRIVEGEILFNIKEDIGSNKRMIGRGEVNIVELSEEQMRTLRGKEMAYIFQDPMTSLNPMLSIGQHFTQLIEAHDSNIEEEAALERGQEILDSLGILPERITDYPHQFSGGMRQRVMIGLGLALRPKLLISDEPTTSLDVVVEAQILEEMAELKEKFNLTMILITHNLGVLAQTADNIAIMYAGRLMEVAATDVLFGDPQHPYTQELLKSVPDVSKPEKKLSWIPGAPPDLLDPPQGCMFHLRCPYVMEICGEVVPPLTSSKTGGTVACHLYTGG